MDKKKAWSIAKPVLKIGFSILALWLVYTKVDIQALQRLWARANVLYFLPAVLVFIGAQLFSSFRLLQFFRDIGLPITVGSNLKLYLLGMFYNLFLPGGIGGDGYKIVALKRQYPTTHKEVFTAVFFDRLSGVWALGFLLTLFWSLLPELEEYRLWVTAGFIAGSIAYYLVLRHFFSRISRVFVKKHLLAVGVQACQLLTVACILKALGCETSYWPYFAIFLLSSVGALFPFSVGGLGAREMAIVWGADIFHLNKDLAVSVSLCFYCITMFIALTAIFILFQKTGRTTGVGKELSQTGSH